MKRPKIKKEERIDIVNEYLNTDVTLHQLGERYDVSHNAIYKIVKKYKEQLQEQE